MIGSYSETANTKKCLPIRELSQSLEYAVCLAAYLMKRAFAAAMKIMYYPNSKRTWAQNT